jgi:hypothetical protein
MSIPCDIPTSLSLRPSAIPDCVEERRISDGRKHSRAEWKRRQATFTFELLEACWPHARVDSQVETGKGEA